MLYKLMKHDGWRYVEIDRSDDMQELIDIIHNTVDPSLFYNYHINGWTKDIKEFPLTAEWVGTYDFEEGVYSGTHHSWIY